VASLVPVEFWIEARRRLSDRGGLAPRSPLLWLAESVHREFVVECRRRGLYAASDPELHAAFDLSYDYDGRSILEEAWRGQGSISAYLRHLEVQEALYPADAVKLRFLENHDLGRAAARFGREARLRNWTLFAMLLPGCFMAYMGQELAMERRIGLFDKETMLAEEGDPSFKPFFARALSLSTAIKEETPFFDARTLAEGVVLVRRHGRGASYSAILNLDGRSGKLDLPDDMRLAGELLMGDAALSGGGQLGQEPLVWKSTESIVL